MDFLAKNRQKMEKRRNWRHKMAKKSNFKKKFGKTPVGIVD